MVRALPDPTLHRPPYHRDPYAFSMQPPLEEKRHQEYPAHWEADVVLRDGGTARIRPITTEDADRLVSFYELVSPESKYYRFFAPYPRLSAKDVHRFTHHDYVDRVGLAATVNGEFIATVRYDRIGAHEAEVAFLVQDAHQGRGVASALLEHIAAVAREREVSRFVAEVLPANNKMIKVFTDAGYEQKRSFEDGSVHLTFDLEPTEASLAVQRAREQRAEARSVQRLLSPRSVAVVGVGRAPGGVGRAVLRNLRGSGFTGRTYAVNRAFPDSLTEVDGAPAHRSVASVAATGDAVDLVVVAVPAAQVSDVVDDCGASGVQGLVVISAGYAESGPEGLLRQRQLLRRARSYGMRVIGPNAFGLINTAEAVRLNASLAPESPARGRIGLFTQSGAIGIALLSALHRRGAGLSSFISAGNRADLSGNDFLQYWHDDPDTDVALLYLESIGNPRKFTRLARRTAAVKPVVVVKGARHSGSAPPGHAVPVTRVPDATVSALLRQAGVVRVDTVTELVDAGLLLADQPLPAGPRVAILGNSESLGLLTYDACLTERLRPLSPVDLTTDATPQDFRDALGRALADDGCDAVLVTAIPWVGENGVTESGDGEVLAAALREAAAGAPAKPVAVVHLEIGGLAEALAEASGTVRPRGTAPAAPGPAAAPDSDGGEAPPADANAPDTASTTDAANTASAVGATHAADTGGDTNTGTRTGTRTRTDNISTGTAAPSADAAPPPVRTRGIPAYPAAERAVRALAQAVRYAQWRRESAEPGRVPEYDDIDENAAATRIEELLATARVDVTRGLALPSDDACELLGLYGIRVLPAQPAPDADTAVAAAGRLGYPVALKATAPHLRHRPDLGGVRLDIGTEAGLRRAYAELSGDLGSPAEVRPVVQAMVGRGVDTVVRSAIDPAVGAVLSFGLAGAPSELLGDTAHRLVPATDRDAAGLIRSIRTAPLLFGWRGSAPVDTAALEELLLRVSRLVDDHPEVVSVALEPVVVGQNGLSVLGAAVRLAPANALGDLGPRRLPSY